MLTALIPPGLTSYLQPLDTAVNGPFKKLLQQAYWMAKAIGIPTYVRDDGGCMGFCTARVQWSCIC
jgi:hypothetical protein